MRHYEIVYILDSTLGREAVDEKLESFHQALRGEIATVDHWGVRQLAYPIARVKTGYYVIVQVAADPTALPEFERLLKLDEQTMRYLIVLNEGQPTSGASVLADPRTATVEAPSDSEPGPASSSNQEPAAADGADSAATDAAPVASEGDEGDDQDAGDAEEDASDAENDADASDIQESSGPPVFSGARGRRRRHDGPPIVLLNYKDVETLSRFLTEQGKILPKRTTKVPARFQRQLGTAVKRARQVALLPYVRDHEA